MRADAVAALEVERRSAVLAAGAGALVRFWGCRLRFCWLPLARPWPPQKVF